MSVETRRYSHAWALRFLWLLRDRDPERRARLNDSIRYHVGVLRALR